MLTMMGRDDRCGWLGDRYRVESNCPCEPGLVLPGELRSSGSEEHEPCLLPAGVTWKLGIPRFSSGKRSNARDRSSRLAADSSKRR